MPVGGRTSGFVGMDKLWNGMALCGQQIIFKLRPGVKSPRNLQYRVLANICRTKPRNRAGIIIKNHGRWNKQVEVRAAQPELEPVLWRAFVLTFGDEDFGTKIQLAHGK